MRVGGIIKDSGSGRYWCPICDSPLVICHWCGCVSATTKEGKTYCDSCGEIINPEGLQPKHRDSTTNQPNIGGVPVRAIDFNCVVTITSPDGRTERVVC